MTKAAEGSSKRVGVSVWIGRVLSWLMAAAMVLAAANSLRGGADLEAEMAKMGLPASMIVPLAVIQVACAVLYVIPQTSVVGAILLTGYLGGAVMTHWRLDTPEQLKLAAVPVVAGVFVWVALCLRDARLWKFMPLKLG